MADLESKWQATSEHLNLLQNNYQASITNQRGQPSYFNEQRRCGKYKYTN